MLRPLVLLLVAAVAASAGTITVISNTGTEEFGQSLNGVDAFTGYVEFGFQTGSTAYSNVTVTANLVLVGTERDDLVAYLTELIGTANTTQEVVQTNTAIPVSSTSFTDVTVLSGVSLAANTAYYVTLAPATSGTLEWALSGTDAFTMDTGVTFLNSHFCTEDLGSCDPTFPPDSGGFSDSGELLSPNDPLFTVTSQTNTGAPEPATFALVGLALALGAAVRRRAAR